MCKWYSYNQYGIYTQTLQIYLATSYHNGVTPGGERWEHYEEGFDTILTSWVEFVETSFRTLHSYFL